MTLATLDGGIAGNLVHLMLLGGLFAIADSNLQVGLSARMTFPLIDTRFISADSGLELDLEIAASGNLSADPVPQVYLSSEGSSLKRRLT